MKYYDEKNGLFFDTMDAYQDFQKKKEEERLKQEALNAEKDFRKKEIEEKIRKRDDIQKEINSMCIKYYKDYCEVIYNPSCTWTNDLFRW